MLQHCSPLSTQPIVFSCAWHALFHQAGEKLPLKVVPCSHPLHEDDKGLPTDWHNRQNAAQLRPLF